jgi:hypothetical protein
VGGLKVGRPINKWPETTNIYMLDNSNIFIKYKSNYKGTVESYKLNKLLIPSKLSVKEFMDLINDYLKEFLI